MGTRCGSLESALWRLTRWSINNLSREQNLIVLVCARVWVAKNEILCEYIQSEYIWIYVRGLASIDLNQKADSHEYNILRNFQLIGATLRMRNIQRKFPPRNALTRFTIRVQRGLLLELITLSTWKQQISNKQITYTNSTIKTHIQYYNNIYNTIDNINNLLYLFKVQINNK